MEWEKIFANHLSDKGLTSKKYKEFLQLKAKKQKNKNKKPHHPKHYHQKTQIAQFKNRPRN